LRLTDPVGMYLPQLGNLEVLTPSTDASGKTTYTTVAAQRPVTVYDLLRHTSGMVYGGFTPNAELKELYAKANVTWSGVTPAEQLENLAKVPLARQPGTMWEYGLSTDVVGRVIEAVTGSKLSRFPDERVFLPPGSGFGLGFAGRRADGLNGAPSSAGEFNWGGAGGTAFWVDPKEQLVAVLMTQAQPGPWQREFKELFRQLVYQAIAE